MTAYIKHKSITVLWELSEKKTQNHWHPIRCQKCPPACQQISEIIAGQI